MSEKAKALPAAATVDRAMGKDLDRATNPTNIITQNDNFTDKTAARIFEVLGAIYAEENNLEVTVTVTKKVV